MEDRSVLQQLGQQHPKWMSLGPAAIIPQQDRLYFPHDVIAEKTRIGWACRLQMSTHTRAERSFYRVSISGICATCLTVNTGQDGRVAKTQRLQCGQSL